MKKVSLLAFAGLLSMSSFADPFYIVKDGQLQDGYSVNMADGGDIMEFGVAAPDGAIAAKYTHKDQYKDIYFDCTKNPINTHEAWYMVIEYMLPESACDQSEDGLLFNAITTENGAKKTMFRAGLFAGDYAARSGNEDLAVDKADANILWDGTLHAVANVWKSEGRLVYLNPQTPTIDQIGFSYCRDLKANVVEDPIYIKTIAFLPYGECYRPIYAENFEPNQGLIDPWVNGNMTNVPVEFTTGGYLIEGNGEQSREWTMNLDPKEVYLDYEMLHQLYVHGAKASEIKNIELGANANGKLVANALVKYKWVDEATSAPFYEDVDNQGLGAWAIFNDEANTTVKLFGEGTNIPGEWTELENEITIPEGATKVSLKFQSNEKDYGYVIDNIQLGLCAPAVDVNEIASESAAAAIYVDGDIVKVYSDADATIEVYSLTGVKVANENISGLAVGSYIAKANTANGVISQIIIKK